MVTFPHFPFDLTPEAGVARGLAVAVVDFGGRYGTAAVDIIGRGDMTLELCVWPELEAGF